MSRFAIDHDDGAASFDRRDVLKASRHELRQEQLDSYNRLHSIDQDARFVKQVSDRYSQLPLVANQRCGAWYVDPNQASSAHAYFKSTDGHAGEWSFSHRRANLHLLELIVEHGGLILVDSTRRGKTFPDALSKTIPLWCAVLNEAASKTSSMPARSALAHLHTPEAVVSRSEHAQMAARVERFAVDFLQTATETILAALRLLDKPLQPLFICPTTSLLPALPPTDDVFTIICLSASSNHKAHDRSQGYAYVPGSGDDHESWSRGLTPPLFWAHRLELLSASRNELDEVVGRLLAEGREGGAARWLQVAERLTVDVTASASAPSEGPSLRLVLPAPEDDEELAVGVVALPPGKKGHSELVSHIDTLLAFAGRSLAADHTLRISFADDDLKDAAAALALSVLIRFYDANGMYTGVQIATATKTSIRSRLHHLATASSGLLQPSRSILTRLNGHFIPR